MYTSILLYAQVVSRIEDCSAAGKIVEIAVGVEVALIFIYMYSVP
jgi:hypothetical protein